MNIYEKLSAIQTELKAPKNQFNKFGGYNYRSCEDILEAVKPLCAKYKTTLVLEDEIVSIGTRYYVKATATLYDAEAANNIIPSIDAKSYAREEESKKGMDGSQVTGASSSYARKYALNGLFSIDDAKDSDATNTGESAAQKPAAAAQKSTAQKKEPVPEITPDAVASAGILDPQGMIDWLEGKIGCPVAMFNEEERASAWKIIKRQAAKNAQAQESV